MTLLLALLVLSAPLAPQDEQHELVRREVRVLELSGTPHERGLAHGRALREEIRELIGDFRDDLETTHGVDAATFAARLLADTNFLPAIEEWTPGLLDEVRGIAEGAELPFEDVYLWQLADEIWSMGAWALREKCTAIAVGPRGDQPTIVAQNMDVPGFYQKYPTLLRIRHEGKPDALVLTCPGLIGVNGMNSASVAVACNTLLQLRPSRDGVPCLFLVRGVLERESLADAEEWLKRVPHAVGQNYTLGDPTGARAFECSAGARVRFQPDPAGDFTYHTNHPLVNADWHPDYLARCAAREVTPEEGLPDCRRIAALEARIHAGAPITVASMRAALASRDDARGPICGDWTYGCTVFLPEQDAPVLELSPGRPDRVAVPTFGF